MHKVDCGYHSGTTLNGTTFHYAVLDDERTDCANRGCGGSLASYFNRTTVVASHEVFEAITDPDVSTGTRAWIAPSSSNQEIGDLCNSNTTRLSALQPDGSHYFAQLEYDNPTGQCIVNKDFDQQHVFYRDINNQIVHIFWDGRQLRRDNWSTATGAPAAAGNPVTMKTSNKQHVFYRDTNNQITHILWDRTTGFQRDSWTRTTNAPLAAGDPAVLATPNQEHLFYRDTNGGLQHIYWDDGDQQLHHVTGVSSGAVGNPSALWTPGQQHLFYRSSNGHVQHVVFTGASVYSDDWTAATGAVAAAGDPVATVVGVQITGAPTGSELLQQHVFYRGTDGHVRHICFDGAFHADDWTPNATSVTVAVGNLTTMVIATPTGQQQQRVFYRGGDNHLRMLMWNGTGLVSADWTSMGATTVASGDPAVLVSSLYATDTQDVSHTQAHVFFVSGNDVKHIWENDASDTGLLSDDWTAATGATSAAAGSPATLR